MNISLETIQELAPDQASLDAAKKLLKPATWPLRGQSESVNTIWGTCQGSGANPYYTMADVVDLGYKCTCPSRKFPCKHVLALYWQFAENPDAFSKNEPPEWVNDWLARRRKGAKSDTMDEAEKPKAAKNIHRAGDEPVNGELSPEETAKREAVQAKRAAQIKADTEAGIQDSLNEFEQWIADQLRAGIGSFIQEINERCRRIAARLVDAKAANLASRMDELPARILSLHAEQQALSVMNELGRLVLLCEAWFADPDDPDVRRSICRTETREQVLEDAAAIHKTGIWEAIGEKIETRRDGLISHTTWLLLVSEPTPCFAVLQDFYPAATGKRQTGAGIGRQFSAELAYYPSRSPLRAFIVQQTEQPQDAPLLPWPISQESHASQHIARLKALPWQEESPVILGSGRILHDRGGAAWWCSNQGRQTLQLSNRELNPLLSGCELASAFMVWNGEQGEILRAQTARWGAVSC
jgi:hypothetical protein